ncbi:DUF4177 domain-containing protein [Clostridium sp.]|uniref:DUF4177 domain-containing protein n=1 Tax=Clostridium sp. TaxID=1506 RepID=UPI0032171A87
MYEYKVLKWRFDLNSAEDLEQELNGYASTGWRVFNIIPNLKGSGSFIYGVVNENEVTIILERVKKN